MGQRHQAFVIARVVPRGSAKPFYRCIAACHHHWCYGRLPLKAVRRFITLLEQKDNAEIVLYEIASINGKYRETPEIADVPCPYTAFLLCQAFSVDLENTMDSSDNRYAYASSFHYLEAGMGSSDGDNNDGISVIDVVTTIAKLDDIRILSLQALAEAWPGEYEDIDAPADTDEADVQYEVPIPRDASPELTSAIQ